jgi:hypothetical protein
MRQHDEDNPGLELHRFRCDAASARCRITGTIRGVTRIQRAPHPMAISFLSSCRSDGCSESGQADPWLAWPMRDVLRMNERDLMICLPGTDQATTPATATERPLRICVVFDDEDSAKSAELLIGHVASGYECERLSFSFDELDPPAHGVAAARSASDSDIFIFAIHDDRMVPRHAKSWLQLCVGLRDEDQDGALVVLIAAGAHISNPGSSLMDYMQTIAITGRMAFFPGQRGIDDYVTPARKQLELEDSLCGSSD